MAPNRRPPQADPTKASAEIGEIAIAFKVNAAIAQFCAQGAPK
jgi:hypothetical protein